VFALAQHVLWHTRMKRLQLAFAGTALILGIGCGGPMQDEGTAFDFSTTGRSPNGPMLNTKVLAAVEVGGATIDGLAVKPKIAGGELVAARVRDGVLLSRHALAGTELSGIAHDGSKVRVRIDDVVEIEDPTPSEVNEGTLWTYYVSVDGKPLCTDSAGNVHGAYALSGRWDYRGGVETGGAKITDSRTFTFACRAIGALGKCVDLGFKPWSTVRQSSLEPYHQACTRLIRADYCGNGVSYTVPGTMIDIGDDLHIRTFDREWAGEAEWSPDGAVCLSLEKQSALQTSLRGTPACELPILASCGSLSTGLMATRFER
jgi:hypothetical protein